MTEELHSELGELLSAYLDDEVTPQERARAEELLASDPEARALYEALRSAASAVRALPKDAAPPDLLDAVNVRLEREALLAGADPEATLQRHRRPPTRGALALAAMLAIAVGGGIYVSLQLGDASHSDMQFARRDTRSDEAFEGVENPSSRNQPTETLGPRGRAQPLADDAVATMQKSTGDEATGDRDRAMRPSSRGGGLATNGIAADSPSTWRAKEAEEAADDVAQVTVDMLARAGIAASDERDAFADAGSQHDSYEAESEGAASATRALRGPHEGKPKRGTRRSGEPAVDLLGVLPTQTDRYLLPYLPPRTFEQRLADGEDWSALEKHPLAVEPVQLRVRFASASEAHGFTDRIVSTFAQRGAVPVSVLAGDAQKDKAATARTSLVQRAAQDAVAPSASVVYLEGAPGVNFPNDPTTNSQVLARVPGDWLIDLIDESAASDPEAITLRIGNWTMQGAASARSMASRAIGPQTAELESEATESLVESRSPVGGFSLASPADSNGRESLVRESSLEPPTDLTEWLQWVQRVAEPDLARATPSDADGFVTTAGIVAIVDGPVEDLPGSRPRTAKHLITIVIDVRTDTSRAEQPEPVP